MKTVWIVLLAVLVFLCAAVMGTAVFLYEAAIARSSQQHSILNKKKKKKKNAAPPTPQQLARKAENERRNAENQAFLAENPPKDLTITSGDKWHFRLHANVFEQPIPTKKWVVWVHGYHGDLTFSVNWIRVFYAHGWNVLAPDLRGHMQSEGHYIGMGWDDRLDIRSWIHTLLDAHPDAEILCAGVSMGAATIMNLAGEDLPDNVKAFIEDCGYTGTGDALGYQLPKLFHLPVFPFLYAANLVIRIRAGYDIFRASVIPQLKKANRPMLFIHGMEDRFVPYEMLDQVYAACASEKERLDVPGARHAASVYTEPELYWNTVFRFADRYFS